MATEYDYDSEHSKSAMKKINKSLRKRRIKGATQDQIVIDTGMTRSTVSRFLNRLISMREAHIAGKTDSPAGGKAVLYKPGVDPNYVPPAKRRRYYQDLPRTFFGLKYPI